jgi:hypothetical protein
MNHLKLEERKLIYLITDKLKNRKLNFSKKKDVIKTYDRLNKIILSEGYSAYDINTLITSNNNIKLVNFLQDLTKEYNKILYNNLSDFNFKENTEVKEFCSRCKIRGFKKVREKLLKIAKSNINKWDGFWSFSDYKKGKIYNIKLIDPDIINKLDK